NASVTIKNKGDFTIQQIQVGHTYSFSYCSDGSWEREIKNMDLSPGETKTYDLHDILIVIEYPFHGWLGACLYAIRPDDHADDHFGDNEVCKKVELLPSSVDLTELPIRHSPSTITDMIRFFAPQEYNFDLTIYNLNGIEVFSSHGNTATGYSIDLNFLPSGIYIFQYYLPVTQKRYVEKILKY
ncbi:MAG: T9SS type A sorting domain-containing protein, partial [Saprospiraceae bacterium]